MAGSGTFGTSAQFTRNFVCRSSTQGAHVDDLPKDLEKISQGTLSVAAFGLIFEIAASQSRIDVATMMNVATLSRHAAAPVMAALGGLGQKADAGSDVVPDEMGDTRQVAAICPKARQTES